MTDEMMILRADLTEAMDKANRTYHTDHDRFSAGRYDGLKQAIELLDKRTVK